MNKASGDFMFFLCLLPFCVLAATLIRLFIIAIFDPWKSKNALPAVLTLTNAVGRIILAWKEPTPLTSYTTKQLRDEIERREAGEIHGRRER